MRARYESWVNGLNGDWCISRQRFFGVPFPVWYPVRADGVDRLRASDRRRTSRGCRSIRRPTCPTATPPSSAASRAGSSAIPTSWTPGRPRRSRRRSSRGWETRRRSVRAHVSDGPAAAGARHHPHVAVLDGAAQPSRARLAAVDARGDLGLGARSRPQEDVEVEGQRRHAARRCCRSTARTACATGRRAAGPAWTRRSTSGR